jgi:hypothetical protein
MPMSQSESGRVVDSWFSKLSSLQVEVERYSYFLKVVCLYSSSCTRRAACTVLSLSLRKAQWSGA